MAEPRKLFSVRYFPSGCVFSVPVGHKARLLPYRQANRVAKRLKRSGVDVIVYSMFVNHRPAVATVQPTFF